ncbi:MAG TPA: aminotransferase class V-fold PLP-dependent enzyme, partial [Candidatus Contendobacter sp.]|nr:aminotransferase class V-fold PLP-dependent enzyme [Candidatus Contendobacter sp.]
MEWPIYLDYAATTPVDPRVVAILNQHLGRHGIFGNPSSNTHTLGATAAKAVETARAHVAALLNADPREIIWTSGATEANNLALLGVLRADARKGRHLITSQTEHKAVLDVCRRLEREGCAVTYLAPASDGLIAPEQV